MDQNKADKMKELGYKLHPACVWCKHGDFVSYLSWGKCMKHNYRHLKHSESERAMSVHALGICKDYEISARALADMGPYILFYSGQDV